MNYLNYNIIWIIWINNMNLLFILHLKRSKLWVKANIIILQILEPHEHLDTFSSSILLKYSALASSLVYVKSKINYFASFSFLFFFFNFPFLKKNNLYINFLIDICMIFGSLYVFSRDYLKENRWVQYYNGEYIEDRERERDFK